MVRRYAVPDWMIAACAEARERGDWRAACAAARIDVAFTGAGPVAGLLAGFAPDLLRWHLPRSASGNAALAAGMRFLLAPDRPITPDTWVLVVRSPRWVTGTQRLTLEAARAGDLEEGPVFPLPPYLWDARRSTELRDLAAPAAGGAAGLLTVAGAGAGGAARPRGAGAIDLWASAGWLIDQADARSWPRDGRAILDGADPWVAARTLRWIADRFRGWSFPVWADGHRRPSRCVRLEVAGERNGITRSLSDPPQPGMTPARPCLHPVLLRQPVEIGLVARGLIPVREVHPLVRAALFPDVPAGSAPPRRDAHDVRVRVRCGGEWHWIGLRGNDLDLLDHTDADRMREQALRAFGGSLAGCFRAESAWYGGEGAVPRGLLEHRRDLWRRMEHGGSRVVLAMLDAGLDPHIRDGQGRTLLHRIHLFDHEELLPRLLAEGLDINAVSRRGWTPMCEALVHSAPAELLHALNAAGAYPQLSLTGPAEWAASPARRPTMPAPAVGGRDRGPAEMS
ncbi:hypothetical protein GCM10010112_49700 [Actinoplanes lobatus]|uniref:Uncharacterized protein n=1 Tax=Actinoplanes lobatus TaxID=113568 RepID=A0A7W7HP77_9ACTN|nr:ankyrin repeat domain-containing protein [Actinoplanes lobatus]MBB4754130.1 hypothetical protein [Actinoplanes lobatus]GGN77027.1 hypothetical protein GCM10010112_49700 [Actinoplanes lobatus]GIE40815.1 hypothetical protein Alo02nite_37130 [Actinoplanes lobatus]